ncbi:MAG: T9SS type A sorting domain-containing protein [Flavobacteriales bacterium]|nr:T9SS type A sorting domain-containing protein [Flavobacteriales bacterium]
MRPLYACITFGLPGALLAQPTANAGMVTGQPGDSFVVHSTQYVNPGPSGANVTFDLSSMISQGTVTQTYSTPGATPYGSSYPTATVAVEGSDNPGSFGYFHETGSLYELIGTRSSYYDLTCSNGMGLFDFPFTYNSTYTDVLSCTGNSSGYPFNRNGSTTTTGDAYGDLILPYGTIMNVLRLHIQQDYLDYLSGLGTSYHYISDGYMYVKPGIHQPVASVYNTSYLVTTTFGTYLDASYVGVQEAMRNAIGIDLVPNPATDRVEILYGSSGDGPVDLELIDAVGRRVIAERRSVAGPGIARQVWDISTLPAGLYTVCVTDQHGQRGSKRLVVQ